MKRESIEGKRSHARQRTADIVVSCARKTGVLALNIVASVGDIVANFVDIALPEPDCAHRGIGARIGGAAGVRVARRIEAAKDFDGARLRLFIEDASGRCDVRLRLEDAATGGKLSPLNLCVEDRENGNTLLEKTCYATGEAVLRGVEAGEYWVEAASSGKTVGMAFDIRASA